jgi:hypothetical protein
MRTKQSGLSEFETEQVRIVLERIACLAHQAGRIIFYSQNPYELGTDEPDALAEKERLWIALEGLSSNFERIGLLADFGAKKVGGIQMAGGIEGWLLPSNYPSGDTNAPVS